MALIRTANEIIEGAFKIIGIFSEERALEQGRTTEALDILNELLDSYANAPEKIAYNSEVPFNLVIDQQSYTFSEDISADVNTRKIVELKYVIIKDDNINYPIDILPDEFLLNRAHLTTVRGRPQRCFFQNENELSRITFFTLPDKTYACRIKAKSILENVALNDNLNEVPRSYHLFLKFALGRLLNSHYPGSTWTTTNESFYQNLLKDIKASSDLDLNTNSGISLLHRNEYDSRSAFYGGR
jgi:hypothetical protein